jgi:hypothetical protein
VPNWLRKLTGKSEPRAVEQPPPFSTKLAVDAPGAPGRANAEALYAKWSSRWQEF